MNKKKVIIDGRLLYVIHIAIIDGQYRYTSYNDVLQMDFMSDIFSIDRFDKIYLSINQSHIYFSNKYSYK